MLLLHLLDFDQNIILVVIKLFTIQDLDLKVIFNKMSTINLLPRKICAILLFTIWLQSASILCKAFTELLLKTYFNVKSHSIVNTLQDIIDDKNLLVMGNDYYFDDLARAYELSPFIISNLKNKISMYIDKFKSTYILHESVIHDMINANSVILTDTMHINYLLGIYNKWNNLFTVSKNKYLANNVNLFVARSNKILRMIYFW